MLFDNLKTIIHKNFNDIGNLEIINYNPNGKLFILKDKKELDILFSFSLSDSTMHELYINKDYLNYFDFFFNIKNIEKSLSSIKEFFNSFNKNSFIKKIFNPILNIEVDNLKPEIYDKGFLYNKLGFFFNIVDHNKNYFSNYIQFKFSLNSQNLFEPIIVIYFFYNTDFETSFILNVKDNSVIKPLKNEENFFESMVTNFLDHFLLDKKINILNLNFNKKLSFYNILSI